MLYFIHPVRGNKIIVNNTYTRYFFLGGGHFNSYIYVSVFFISHIVSLLIMLYFCTVRLRREPVNHRAAKTDSNNYYLSSGVLRDWCLRKYTDCPNSEMTWPTQLIQSHFFHSIWNDIHDIQYISTVMGWKRKMQIFDVTNSGSSREFNLAKCMQSQHIHTHYVDDRFVWVFTLPKPTHYLMGGSYFSSLAPHIE